MTSTLGGQSSFTTVGMAILAGDAAAGCVIAAALLVLAGLTGTRVRGATGG